MIEDARDEFEPATVVWDDVFQPEEIPSSWEPPLALRIAAFGWVMLGLFSIEEMVLNWFIFHRDWFNPGFLFIFLGRGLVRWKRWARSWTIFFGTLMFVTCAIGGVLSLVQIIRGGPPDPATWIFAWPAGSWQATLVSFAGFAILLWMFRTLSRRDVTRRFDDIPVGRRDLIQARDQYLAERGRWRWSLRSMFLIMFTGSLLALRLTANDVFYITEDRNVVLKSGPGHKEVYYGISKQRFDPSRIELEYVVLVTGQLRGRGESHWSGGRKISLHASSEDVVVPSNIQLHEIREGQPRSRDERISYFELTGFLDSKPVDLSLEALIKHAEEMRAKQGK